MKSSVFALLLVVAGAFAFPQYDGDSTKNNVVEQQIRNIIEQFSEAIRKLGLDPLIIESAGFEHIATPGAIEVRGSLSDVSMSGGSNFDINNLQYIPGLNRLIFDISLPKLEMIIGDSGLEILFFEYNLDTSLTGSLAIKGMRLAGEVNLVINLVDGISIRSITLDFYGGLVESNLTLKANEWDLSEILNRIFSEKIPALIADYNNEINRGLEAIVRFIVNILM